MISSDPSAPRDRGADPGTGPASHPCEFDRKSLNRLKDQITPEQALTVMKQVAEGVQAAHRTGLIHCDLKPGKILVQRTEEGEWKPYVMDFGIIREIQAPGMTAAGVVIGTYDYMPPEQARGEVHRLDRRADVYALGATLHELLGGQPPFAGPSSVDTIVDILQKEVPPLRKLNSAIPRDLETVVQKCLVEFEADEHWSLMDLVRAEKEFSALFHRRVELVDRKGLLQSTNWIRRDTILRTTAVAIRAG